MSDTAAEPGATITGRAVGDIAAGTAGNPDDHPGWFPGHPPKVFRSLALLLAKGPAPEGN